MFIAIWVTKRFCRHLEEGDNIVPQGFCLCFFLSLYIPCPVSPTSMASPTTFILVPVKSLFLNPEFQPSSEHLSHVLSESQTEQVQTSIHYLLPPRPAPCPVFHVLLCGATFAFLPLHPNVFTHSYHFKLSTALTLPSILASWSFLSDLLPPQSIFYTASRVKFQKVNLILRFNSL